MARILEQKYDAACIYAETVSQSKLSAHTNLQSAGTVNCISQLNLLVYFGGCVQTKIIPSGNR